MEVKEIYKFNIGNITCYIFFSIFFGGALGGTIFWWVFVPLYLFLDNIFHISFNIDVNIFINSLMFLGILFVAICTFDITFKEKTNNSINNRNINFFNKLPDKITQPKKHTQTTQVYERNQELKNICINRANFQCEIDKNHKSFISSKQHNYVEAHHIIPLSFQNKFDVNLDSLENLISLCPICHKAIHNGSKEEKLKILKLIHIIRQPFNISFEELKRIYNI